MSTTTTDLFLLEDLNDDHRTTNVAKSDLDAMRAVADWMKSFVVNPHSELGRPGPVCPFVPGALERNTLWLAPESIGDGGASHVVEVIDGYKRLFRSTAPTEGDELDYKVIVVLFTDLAHDRAGEVFGEVLDQIAVPSYVEDGTVYGAFFEGNAGTAIYNDTFRPFQSPVPFIFVRHGVVADWKFFLDNEALFNEWARRFVEAATHALADEVRHLPWRTYHG